MSLYTRLFKYAPSPGRSQLENFLTESLCDILDQWTSVDRKSMEAFVCEAILALPSRSFSDRLRHASSLYWTTQERFTFKDQCGFLDLCLLADGKLLLLIESKIDSGFTTHSVTDETVTKDFSQLQFYDMWLADSPDVNAALVLLTHLRDAPPGFEISEGNPPSVSSSENYVYRTPLRQKSRWVRVYEWLKIWHEKDAKNFRSDDGIFLQILVGHFLEFLQEKNMAKSTIENSDVQLLGSYMSRDIWNKVSQLAESTRTVVAPLLPNLYSPPKSPPVTKAFNQTQILWDWGYCYEPPLMWYIGWGLSGPPGLKDLGISPLGELCAFVLVASEKLDIPLVQTELDDIKAKPGWSVHERTRSQKNLRLLKTVPAQELAETPGGFNEAFTKWTKEAVTEAASLLGVAHKRLTPREANTPILGPRRVD